MFNGAGIERYMPGGDCQDRTGLRAHFVFFPVAVGFGLAVIVVDNSDSRSFLWLSARVSVFVR
jgi:hypothetical protein